MSISPHHTGFRNISSLLAESKLKITKDASLATEATNNFQSLGPGDPNSIFADGPASVAREVTHDGNGFFITYEFTNEGKRPLNKILFQFAAGDADDIKISLSDILILEGSFSNITFLKCFILFLLSLLFNIN